MSDDGFNPLGCGPVPIKPKETALQPDLVLFSVGRTIFGQALTLTRGRRYDGRLQWTLHQEASSTRDESASIYGLTEETILQMADAVRAVRRQP